VRGTDNGPGSAAHRCASLALRRVRDDDVWMSIVIKPIGKDERATWEPLWQGYLRFYKSSQTPEETEVTWLRIFEATEPMFALGAYADEKLLGIVHYLYHRSFWTVGNYCYLQDLFVAEEARNRGLARALIEAVMAEARLVGASRVHWLTQEDNATARALYDKLADKSGFIQYRKIF